MYLLVKWDLAQQKRLKSEKNYIEKGFESLIIHCIAEDINRLSHMLLVGM